MLRDNLLRTTAGIVPRPRRSVSLASYVLLAGLSIVVFAFLPGSPYRLDQYDLPKDVALAALGAVSALYLLSSHSTVPEDRLEFTLAAFLGCGLLAAPFVGENHVLAWRTVGLFAAAASVFLLARRVGASGGGSDEIFTGITLIIGLMCAMVVLEAYGGIPFLSAPGRRPGASLGNRNLAARLACMALPLLWTRLVANKDRTTRYVVLMALSGAIAVIVLSRSRGALLVACVQAVLLPAVTRWRAPAGISRRWRSAATVWIAGFLFSSAVVAVLPNRLGWNASDFASSARRVTEYQRGTGRGRLIQAATTWRMIRHNPV